jgi:hypothetical protein
MSYEPPNGIDTFVRILQMAAPGDAAEVLRLAFAHAAAEALLAETRLNRAAPRLLDACRLARDHVETGQRIDWNVLTEAIAMAEGAAEAAR